MCKRKLTQDDLFFALILLGVAYLFTVIFSLLSGVEDTDEELSAHRYCKMVNSGEVINGETVRWPDYQKNYAEFCIGDRWNGK